MVGEKSRLRKSTEFFFPIAAGYKVNCDLFDSCHLVQPLKNLGRGVPGHQHNFDLVAEFRFDF
jgi:hypothetical protein